MATFEAPENYRNIPAEVPLEPHPSPKNNEEIETGKREEEIKNVKSREELSEILERWNTEEIAVIGCQHNGSIKIFSQEEIRGMVDLINSPLSENKEVELRLTRQFGIRAKWNELVATEQRASISQAKSIDELLEVLENICPLKSQSKGWLFFEESKDENDNIRDGLKNAIQGIQNIYLNTDHTDEVVRLALTWITTSCDLQGKVKELLDIKHMSQVFDSIK
jgi:hypothetical protein